MKTALKVLCVPLLAALALAILVTNLLGRWVAPGRDT
jgi:hypothetical protein